MRVPTEVMPLSSAPSSGPAGHLPPCGGKACGRRVQEAAPRIVPTIRRGRCPHRPEPAARPGGRAPHKPPLVKGGWPEGPGGFRRPETGQVAPHPSFAPQMPPSPEGESSARRGRRALQKASPLVGEVPQCAHWGGRGGMPRLSERLNLRMPPSVTAYAVTAPPQGGSQGRAHTVRPCTPRRGPPQNSSFLIHSAFLHSAFCIFISYLTEGWCPRCPKRSPCGSVSAAGR